jgi:phytoene dehydrogenase-like protein
MTAAAVDDVVIGGGADGLVAATRLGKAGRRVLLLEAADALGGQRRLLEFAPGFRAAPLAIDPGWLPAPIARALGFAPPAAASADAPVSVPLEPGTFLSLPRDPARAADAIRPHSPRDAARWQELTALLRALSGFLETVYLTPAPAVDVGSIRDLLPLAALARRFRALGGAAMVELLQIAPMSVQDLLDDRLEHGPLKAAVATAGIRDVRQGPRSGGTGFTLLHYLVGAPVGSVRGRSPWEDGPEAVTRRAGAAARQAGVTLRTGAKVVRLDVKDDAIAGVVLDGGETIPATSVLSTVNPVTTLLDWVDPVWLDPEIAHTLSRVRHRGCTAFVLYALESAPELPGLAPTAAAGIVSLTRDTVSLERAADAAKYGRVAERPHVELTVPTLLWPAHAPSGRHVAVVRVAYAPYRLAGGARWDGAAREALALAATRAVEEVSPGFAARVLHRAVLTPEDLEERFGLREGAPAQVEVALDQILFMRPCAGWGRHATPIRGLFLGGCGSHPGPGIAGGAGWLAAGRMLASPDGAQ